jgi:hypothetical protein
LGKKYEEKKDKNPYYRFARFFSAEEVIDLLKRLDLKKIKIFQTLFGSPEAMLGPDEVKGGYGKGGFVVIGGTKNEGKSR